MRNIQRGLFFGIVLILLGACDNPFLQKDGSPPFQDGSASHPFLVYNQTDLLKISKDTAGTAGDGLWTLEKHYKQMANITLTGEWTRIGVNTAGQQFTGSYDGGAKTITGLTFTTSTSSIHQGMFGFIGSGGVVKNLTLEGVSITAGDNTGGVVGTNNGTVENCSVTGTVTGGNNTGGVVGQNGSGSGTAIVQNCSATGTVTGGNNAGGVAGSNNGGTVQNCYATGAVSGGGDYTGGVAGQNFGNIVQNCYALNPSVKSIPTMNVGRVTGFNAGVLYYNYAWNGMTVMQGTAADFTGGTAKPSIGDALNSIDGKGITAAEAKDQDAWDTAGFSFGTTDASPWVWQNGRMPRLYFEAAGRVWPSYLVD